MGSQTKSSGHSPGSEPSCPNCGESSFQWGKAIGHYTLKFKSEDAGLLERATVFGGKEILARLCKTCSNVQLFIERHPSNQPIGLAESTAEQGDATDAASPRR